jgi:predicted nucleic-acid-binding Zn-ribbon protein
MYKLTTLATFLERAKEVHGDKYDYSEVEYNGTKHKVSIICKEHGHFLMTPEKHIARKQGCPFCAGLIKTTENFIKRSEAVHGKRYDYSVSKFTASYNKIDIICREHGLFSQTAIGHYSGGHCPKCVGKNKTNEEVVQKFIEVHGDKYDYSLIDYKGQRNKMSIICPKHGIFKQTFNIHKKGHGCPICAGAIVSTNHFIEKAKLVHGNKFDYSESKYINSNKKIKIICSIHGAFYQKPNNHLQGQGCPNCKGMSITEKKTKSTEEYIKEAFNVHGDKYDYSQVEYVGCRDKINILCKKHGVFSQDPDSHLHGAGCPKCGVIVTQSENEIKTFIHELGIGFEDNDRNVLDGLEIDILIPEKRIAIEYDGIYWHSEKFIERNFHLNKTQEAEKAGYNLIHIFEDEWKNKPEVVKSRLRNILGKTPYKLYARKCLIKEVNSSDSIRFLDVSHLQGGVNSSVRLGLYYDNELVSLMTFGRGRLAMGGNSDQFELVRFCNKLNTSVIGAASRLLSYFIKKYIPKEIISYADKRWSVGDLYDKLGFIKTHESRPNYWYVIGKSRKHRFGFRKSILVKQGYDASKSEHEIMLDRKIYRIYDCGTIVYKKTL